MKYIAILIIISLPFLYSFTSGFLNPAYNDLDSSDNVTLSGKDIYLKNCAVCHKEDMSGNPPAIPSLKDVDKRLDKSQVAEILLKGRNAMPSFSYLSEQERKAVINFLFGENTSVELTKELSDIEKGERLFVANCAICHKKTPDDPEPAGVKNYGMKPAVLGSIDKRMDFDRFVKVVDAGPCYMPSFDKLSVKDKKHIYTYLSSITVENLSSSGMGKMRNCRGRCSYR